MNNNVYKKVYENPRDALQGLLYDGMTIMSGGFGLCCEALPVYVLEADQNEWRGVL